MQRARPIVMQLVALAIGVLIVCVAAVVVTACVVWRCDTRPGGCNNRPGCLDAGVGFVAGGWSTPLQALLPFACSAPRLRSC